MDAARINKHIAAQQGPQLHRLTLSPDECYDYLVDAGVKRPRQSFLKQTVLAVLAGCYLGLGFTTCMLAGGQMSKELRTTEPGLFNTLFGAFGLPMGLSLVVLTGGNLVTSNMGMMIAAGVDRKVNLRQIVSVLVTSYIMNAAGCLLIGQLLISGQTFLHREEFTVELATKKCGSPFLATFVKGILCNWLVNMSIWQANMAQDITGKLLAIWFPISAFVTMGFEHCVVNMFLVPLGIRLGAPVTVGDFIVKNLIPVTLGNFIGGAGFCGVAFCLAYGDLGKAIEDRTSDILDKIFPRRIKLRMAAEAASYPDNTVHSRYADSVISFAPGMMTAGNSLRGCKVPEHDVEAK